MELKCQHCSNIWNYGGKNPYYAYCSKCHHLVSIKKQAKRLIRIQSTPVQPKVETKGIDFDAIFERAKHNTQKSEELIADEEVEIEDVTSHSRN